MLVFLFVFFFVCFFLFFFGREQAATALLASGIRVVIAHSFNETYTRNAWNNGLIVLECPKIVEAVKQRLINRMDERTIRDGRIVIDFKNGYVVDEESGTKELIQPVGGMAQELVVKKGLLNYVVEQAKRKQ